jgi:hypothetical protein
MAGDWYPNENAPDSGLSGQIASAQNAGLASHPGRPSPAPDSALGALWLGTGTGDDLTLRDGFRERRTSRASFKVGPGGAASRAA